MWKFLRKHWKIGLITLLAVPISVGLIALLPYTAPALVVVMAGLAKLSVFGLAPLAFLNSLSFASAAAVTAGLATAAAAIAVASVASVADLTVALFKCASNLCKPKADEDFVLLTNDLEDAGLALHPKDSHTTMRKKLSGSGPSSPSDHITMSDGIRRRHNAGSDSSFKRNKSHDDLDTTITPQTIEDEISRSQPAF